jgi:pimeloyl-ACP methyl ester carboxylesterase
MTGNLLTCRGGQGEPLVLVHGLMGRGSTWSRQLGWLNRLGTVYTYDAPWHRGQTSTIRIRSAPNGSWPIWPTR